jgi:RNA polymerase sigma-B factor
VSSSAASPRPAQAKDLCRLETSQLWPLRDQHQHQHAVREELVRRFTPIARRLAARYRTAHEPFEDVLQVASLGLLHAVDRFDPDQGPSFNSFAIPTILGEIKRYFRDTGWSVHVPRGAQELALRVNEATRQLTEQNGRAPRVDELAQFMETSTADVLDALEAANAHYTASLDAPVQDAEQDAPTFIETLGTQDDSYRLVDTTLALSAAVRALPYWERRALSLRFNDDLKQVEIARQLGCSQMHVSRLLRRALAKLRTAAEPL